MKKLSIEEIKETGNSLGLPNMLIREAIIDYVEVYTYSNVQARRDILSSVGLVKELIFHNLGEVHETGVIVFENKLN